MTLRRAFSPYTPAVMVAHLGKTKLFSGLLAEEMHSLAQTAEMRFYRTGATIFQEGDPGDGLYIVIEGMVQVSALVGHDQRRVLTRIGPGDFFGEMAVLDNEPRSATASAEVDTKVYYIQREDLMQVLERSPRLAVSLVREFSLRMREFNRQYIEEVLQAERLTLVGRFARSIVHDFKNPLNIIGLAAELAGMEKASPELRHSAQQRIRKQVDRLSNMINELLEFTRGSQSSIVLARTDYARFALPLLEELRPELAEKSIALELPVSPPEMPVLLDQHRLPHVFYNLIHNAIEAMPDGGKVTVRFRVTGDRIFTEVEDTGKGIPPEIANRLFEPFATYGKASGTGLGLSICRKIIEDHRGDITAESQPGKGAVFTVSLPLARSENAE